MNILDLFRPAWKDKADKAAAARDAGIPEDWRLRGGLPTDSTGLPASSGILSDRELEIVGYPAHGLRSQIAGGALSAEEVARAYCKAAAVAQQATNCLVELFVDEAIARARELDAHRERTGEVVGPLHGVPVSIKDHICVKGHDTPSGFLARVGKSVAPEDAYLVKTLRDAGAVLYCKTMNPQAIMHLETANYLGTTVCPRNRRLTAGGSSGGEGALLGMRASPLGVGTDIGGSVRSPAAAGGIFAFKPSVGRLPYLGIEEPGDPPGCETILGTPGPMARHEDDLELFMQIIAASEPWRTDPSCHFRPWNPPQPSALPTPEKLPGSSCEAPAGARKLRIGVLSDDGVVRPVPPIRRALDTVVAALRGSKRFELVEFPPFRSAEAWDIIRRLYFAADEGGGILAQCAASGEPVLPLTRWIIDEGGFGGRAPPLGEVLKMTAERDAFRLAFAGHWAAAGVDAVLCPVGPTPAPALLTAKYWNYTSFWNLVDYPAAVFPTGLRVRPDDEAEGGKARNDKEKEIWKSYDPKTADGAPLCLQLVSYIGHDEETLAALRQVMAVVRAHVKEEVCTRPAAETETEADSDWVVL